jgi:hypothetical protein
MAMNGELDNVTALEPLGPADDVVAPQTVFTGGDSPYLVIMAAFRSALLDGREPHARHTTFDDDVDLEALLPDDAEIVRSVTDDDDTVLFARGPGYSLFTSTIGERSVWVTARTREAVNAIVADLQANAKRSGNAKQSPGQYL